MEPALPSQPPPPPDGSRGEARPMSPFAATGWAFGATFAFLVLLKLTESFRSAASGDIINAFICQSAAYLLALFLILRVHAPDASIRSFLGLRATHVALYPIGIALGAAIEIPANALFEAITRRWPIGDDEDTLAALFSDASPGKRVAIAVIVIAVGPLVEEAFFRGALWKPLRAGHSAAFTMILTAALFALAHIDWQMAVPIVLVGLVLGFLRSASGSLAPSLLAHVTFNALPFYAMATQKPGDHGDAPMPFALVAAGAVGVAVLLGLARLVAARTEGAALARKKDGA